MRAVALSRAAAHHAPCADTGDCPTVREGVAFADTGGYPKRMTASRHTRVGVFHTCSRFTTHENALLRGLYEGLYLGGGMALRGRFTLLKPHTALDQNFQKFLGY